MKQYQKYSSLVASLALAAGSMVGLAGIAQAQTAAYSAATGMATTTTSTMANTSSMSYPAPMVVDIANDGSGLIRGTVASTGTNSITINTWGGTWTIELSGSGTVASSDNSLSGIKAGDFVGADGTMAGESSMTFDAMFVRDWTTNPYSGTAATSGSGTMTGGANMPATTTGTNTTGMSNDGTTGTMNTGDMNTTSASGTIL